MNLFYQKFNNIILQTVPQKVVYLSNYSVWFNVEIRRRIRAKRKLHKKVKAPLYQNEDLEIKLESLSNVLKAQVKKAFNDYQQR